MHTKPKLNQVVSVDVQRIGISGEAVASFQGYTLFIEGALPPETVQARITEVKKSFGRAKLVSIDTVSPHRIEAPCPLFGRCGGCQTMHMRSNYQLEVKRARIVDALCRIAKLDDVMVEPCLESPHAYSYRNKVQMPIRNGKNGLIIGFFARNSHDIVEVDVCHIHCPLGQNVYENVSSILKKSEFSAYDPKTGRGELCSLIIKSSTTTQQALVALVTNGSGPDALKATAEEILQSMPEIQGVVQIGKTYKTLAGKSSIEENILGFCFHVSSASFFQVNPLQAERLYSKVVEFCELEGHETVLDAYCGVGTLSIILSQHAKEVLGVEVVKEAIVDAKRNAKKNGIENVRFFCQKTEDFIQRIDHIDVCVLNPPRAGCKKEVLEKLGTLSCKKIIYVSCDPATLARDLGILVAFGYKVVHVQPFDMFPQTAHVETVVCLQMNCYTQTR